METNTSGTTTAKCSDSGTGITVFNTLSFRPVAQQRLPKMAGATLSGCPSIRLAMMSNSSFESGLFTRLLASKSPPTIAVLLLPRPRDGGIRVSEVI